MISRSEMMPTGSRGGIDNDDRPDVVLDEQRDGIGEQPPRATVMTRGLWQRGRFPFSRVPPWRDELGGSFARRRPPVTPARVTRLYPSMVARSRMPSRMPSSLTLE